MYAFAHLEQATRKRSAKPGRNCQGARHDQLTDVKESMKNSGRTRVHGCTIIEGEDSNLYDVVRSGESPNPDKFYMSLCVLRLSALLKHLLLVRLMC